MIRSEKSIWIVSRTYCRLSLTEKPVINYETAFFEKRTFNSTEEAILKKLKNCFIVFVRITAIPNQVRYLYCNFHFIMIITMKKVHFYVCCCYLLYNLLLNDLFYRLRILAELSICYQFTAAGWTIYILYKVYYKIFH